MSNETNDRQGVATEVRRWVLTPTRHDYHATLGGLRQLGLLYRPRTMRGRGRLLLTRSLRGLSLARPGTQSPWAEDVLRALGPWLADDYELVMMKSTNRRRWVALVTTRDQPQYVVKVGVVGDASLRVEEEALLHYHNSAAGFLMPRLLWSATHLDFRLLFLEPLELRYATPDVGLAFNICVELARLSHSRGVGVTHGDLSPLNLATGPPGNLPILLDWEHSLPHLAVGQDLAHYLWHAYLTRHAHHPRLKDVSGKHDALISAYATGISVEPEACIAAVVRYWTSLEERYWITAGGGERSR